MTPDDFIRKYVGLFEGPNHNVESVGLLAAIVDTSKDGLVSYAEFQAFEGLLCFPDALYKTAFQLFDTNGNGMVSFGRYLPGKLRFHKYRQIRVFVEERKPVVLVVVN